MAKAGEDELLFRAGVLLVLGLGLGFFFGFALGVAYDHRVHHEPPALFEEAEF